MEPLLNRLEVRVRYADTDQMSVAHHARFLEWFEMGRTELMRSLGLTYRELEEMGYRLPVAEVGVRYLAPAAYDDLLVVKTTLGESPRPRLRLEYEVWRGEELLATGYTVHVFVSRNGRAVKPPKAFLDLLRNGVARRATSKATSSEPDPR